MDSIDLADDTESTVSRARYPPPVQPPPTGVENSRRQTQPSVSIEQAAKPNFGITVGDPHKVGDLTSSHIVYQVRTKVGYACLLALPTIFLFDLLTVDSADIIKSLQTVRICCEPAVPGFSMALQLITREQPGCGCPAAS